MPQNNLIANLVNAQNQARQEGVDRVSPAYDAEDPIGAILQQEADREALDNLFSSLYAPPVSNTTESKQTIPPNQGATVNRNEPNKKIVGAVSSLFGQDTPQTPAKTQDIPLNQPKPNPPDKDPFAELVPSYIEQYRVPKSFGSSESYLTDSIARDILRASRDTGVDPHLLFSKARIESRFNPLARPIDPKTGKAKSSAYGMFQFLDATWDDVMNRMGVKNKYKLKGDRSNTYESAVAAAEYIKEIHRQVSRNNPNVELTPGWTYLGYFAGPGMAGKVAKAIEKGNGTKPANTVFTSSQIKANKPVFYNYIEKVGKDGKTVREYTTMKTINEVVKELDDRIGYNQSSETYKYA
jgi:hypothetical protein